MPTFDCSGQAVGALPLVGNCASEQVWRPLAADGFKPIPVGSATAALLVTELSWLPPPVIWGTGAATVAPEGESVWAVAGSMPMPGA